MPSSRKTRSSGRGRKSPTTFSLPSGSSVYLILALIDCLTPSPVTGAKDSNGIVPIRESNRQHSATHRSPAVCQLINTAGDLMLLPRVLDAASRFERPPPDAEM